MVFYDHFHSSCQSKVFSIGLPDLNLCVLLFSIAHSAQLFVQHLICRRINDMKMAVVERLTLQLHCNEIT